MVTRLKVRRILFLVSLVFSTIVVFELLIYPIFLHLSVSSKTNQQELQRLVKLKLSSLLYKQISPLELLLKNSSRKVESPEDFMVKLLEENDQRDIEEKPLQPKTISKDMQSTFEPVTEWVEEAGEENFNNENAIEVKDEKFWFFKNGNIWPSKGFKGKIWPHEDPTHDRILEQLMHIPDSYVSTDVKTVLLTNNLGAWNVPMGPNVFKECPVSACSLSNDMSLRDEADVVMFRNGVQMLKKEKRDQIWILYMLESPSHTLVTNIPDAGSESHVDWTATYRVDSDVVTPYEKWVYYNPNVRTLEENKKINFAAGKTHQAAWFVSNCDAPNNRLDYARKLQKYISVDIYGNCGKHICPRSNTHGCFDLLDSKYKFYLSFENSNCKDYITEKFFVNGLGNKILPIVMGATKDEYNRVSPDHSFIHVDDFDSPQKLAEYLHQLDKNDTLYNGYFQWKGTGEFINTHFWCRLCTMIHDAASGASGVSGKYVDVERWWHGETCKNEGWRASNGNH